jgi:hypothetical protein
LPIDLQLDAPFSTGGTGFAYSGLGRLGEIRLREVLQSITGSTLIAVARE